MDHVQLIKSTIFAESKLSQASRNAVLPHASGALLCPRRNILQWMELAQAQPIPLLGNHLEEAINLAIKPEDEIPGVFTVGHMFDSWAKHIYYRIASEHEDIVATEGRPRLFHLPMTEEDIGVSGAIPIAGEYDMLTTWGNDTKITDLIDFKTCKSLYMYEKKGPSMHHIAQLSVYAYGLMVNRFDSMIIKPEQIKEFKHDTRLVLLYIEKNSASMLAFHVDLFPLKSLRSYFGQLSDTMRCIRGRAQQQESITREQLPPAVPSFDWECKWKTGCCKYYETFCKEEQNALRGTAARAESRAREDRLSQESGGDGDGSE